MYIASKKKSQREIERKGKRERDCGSALPQTNQTHRTRIWGGYGQ